MTLDEFEKRHKIVLKKSKVVDAKEYLEYVSKLLAVVKAIKNDIKP